MVSRKIKWLASVDGSNRDQVEKLEKDIALFYEGNPDYYGDIEFTSDNWINNAEAGYKQILEYAQQSKRICEFGCGSANILKHFPALQHKYSGCDFSGKLMKENALKYPGAEFKLITKPNDLPFPDKLFDLVFSVFVIEHSTQPSRLLNECKRILKPGGRLVILCPDFLGQGRMSSQRAGWSEGNSSQKLKAGKWLDAIITLYDNRIKVPFHCRQLRKIADKHPGFFINMNPTVFQDKFYPDVDAVYLTYRNEIEKYLEEDFELESNTEEVCNYTSEKKLIFLSFKRK